MFARFLLGPAGSGKTFRCLAEIRALLKQDPEGAPIIFLAPKQATYQLERQLLADDSLQGFTRLRILSFERLARFILETLRLAPPPLLSDEGRIMVLRALLLRHEKELKLFQRSARRPGFAQQLGGVMRELQQHQITPATLRARAQGEGLRSELREKLEDLALIHEKYSLWLTENKLQDTDCLLDFAADVLKGVPSSRFRVQALYFDGFAEMTPQELDLLAAVLPFCESSTLAFCLNADFPEQTKSSSSRPTASSLSPQRGEGSRVRGENYSSASTLPLEIYSKGSWLSIWNTVRQTYQRCRQRIENLSGAKIEIEILPDDPKKTRFSNNLELSHLEKAWATAGDEFKTENLKLKIRSCADPNAEAVLAAREILRFVRAGNRFRDCAVLVRDLENYHKPLAQTFRRYQIPFFLDRRENVAHHPLAELTRGVLRTMLYDWQHDDFFSALKAGFSPVKETQIDGLENAALEFGWRGKKWREPLPDESFEKLRKKILPPFEGFYGQLVKLDFKPNGRQLAELFRGLWDDLNVATILENWAASGEDRPAAGQSPAIHAGVLEQMNALLDNLELGLVGESLPLRDWLPILESGLANLTVGVIPPVLDEVLVGAVDRARNPDLKFALALGVNESVFPAVPSSPVILTETDRQELELPLGPDLREQISRERFYGYIACTRASEKLTVTFSRSDADGIVLNPSPFISQLQKIFPALEVEEFQNKIGLDDIESKTEITPFIFETPGLDEIPGLADLREQLAELREPDPDENLTPSVAARLYKPVLRTSVSRLEEFASCPFRFFVRSGLRAEERKVFELDARERGSFQHDILKRFHDGIIAEGKQWRDLTPHEARDRIESIAGEMLENYRSGLLNETAQSRFAAHALMGALQDFVAVTVSWLREQNQFDPVASELDFGSKESPQTAWEINLSNGKKLALTGRIDRVDLWRNPAGSALAVVLDYKSSHKKLDALLVEHGIQLQLLAYLNVLRHWKEPRPIFGADQLVPQGVFYVNLRGQFENGDSRDDVLGKISLKNSPNEPLNLAQTAWYSNDRPPSPAVPSPLPSDGRGEGQGEVRVSGFPGEDDESRRVAYRHTGRFDASALDKLDTKHARDQFNYRLKNDGTLYAGLTEALAHEEFAKLLDRVEIQLREFGDAIYSGIAGVDPYRKGKQTPCEYCDYKPVCRIDPWTHKYRMLQ